MSKEVITGADSDRRGGMYDYVKIPVMVCCNDEHGNFAGQIYKIEFHDSLDLETHYWDEDANDLVGMECDIKDSAIVIGDCAFPFIARRCWVGNICWDLFVLYGKDALALLNFLRESKRCTVESGETRLFRWWEGDKPFGDTHLGLIAKHALDFRL